MLFKSPGVSKEELYEIEERSHSEYTEEDGLSPERTKIFKPRESISSAGGMGRFGNISHKEGNTPERKLFQSRPHTSHDISTAYGSSALQ